MLLDREPAALACAALSAVASGIPVEGLDLSAAGGSSGGGSRPDGGGDGGGDGQAASPAGRAAASGSHSGSSGAPPPQAMPAWPGGLPDMRRAAQGLLAELRELGLAPAVARCVFMSSTVQAETVAFRHCALNSIAAYAAHALLAQLWQLDFEPPSRT